MDRRKFSFSLIATAVLAGCGGGGGGGGDGGAATSGDVPAVGPIVDPVVPVVTAPELATPTSLPAATAFLQTVAATDRDPETAPGQANVFDLDRAFMVADGGNDQLDGALDLSVDAGSGPVSFPPDQSYSELTALGPELTAADGVKAVTFAGGIWANSGSTSAVFHGVPDVRLQQTLDLTSAAGHAVNLTWLGVDKVQPSQVPGEPFFLQVVLRDAAGALLTTLYRNDNGSVSGTWGSGSLSAYAGSTVVLSFEQTSSTDPHNPGNASTIIDNVSVVDVTTGTEFVTNGDFEAAGAGWTVPAVRVSQNVRSGLRTLPGLGTVQRTFFTQPNVLWGRMTDVFTNTSSALLSATISYSSNLGSDGAGIIYPTPGAPAKGLSTWDGLTGDRDTGFVFGNTASVAYTSATALQTFNGSDVITVTFTVNLAAGASVTLINFVLLAGGDTNLSATDVNARATEIDTLAADIANNFRTNSAYQRGLTQAQLDTLKNF